ncbi:MAG: carbohydrate binding domain-containing protein [Cyanobacteria bacterium]|nr:carbohydrate binding domain-containing protein [Cyanobacteriota bacterium]
MLRAPADWLLAQNLGKTAKPNDYSKIYFTSFTVGSQFLSSRVNNTLVYRLPRLSCTSLTKAALGSALGLGVIASGSAQASIVLNGGFENGLAGWACTISNNALCDTNSEVFGAAPEGSAYFIGFDNNPPGILSQTLQTVVGTTYDISFLFNSGADEPDNALSVQVGSLSYTLDLVANTWTTYSGTFTAASSSTPLNFLFKTVSGSGLLGLDNVVVNETGSATSVPGPLPLFGAGAAFGWSRRLRKRIAAPLSTPPQA